MINSTWLIFGGLGITAITALVLSAGSGSAPDDTSVYTPDSNSNLAPLLDYRQNQNQNLNYENAQQSPYEYDETRNIMQAYGGKRRRKTKRSSKRIKKSVKRLKK
jgi:hypothetical protein